MSGAANVQLTVNGHPITVPSGISVAAAIAISGAGFRRSITGQSRAPHCGMGMCFECRVCINGVSQQRACMTNVSHGMRVKTDE